MQVTIDRLQRELAQRRGVQGRNQRLEKLHCRLQAQVRAACCCLHPAHAHSTPAYLACLLLLRFLVNSL